MHRWKLLGRMFLAAVLLLLVGCAKKEDDPLTGTWKFNTGASITFRQGGKMDGVAENGQSWTGTWRHEGDFLNMESTGFHSLAGKKRWRVMKLFHNEVMLKAADPKALEYLTGTREDTK